MNWLQKISQLDLTFTSEVTGAYRGQVNIETGAWLDKRALGYIQYSIYQDEIHINHVLVLPEYRRQGIATALMNKVKEENPEMNINFGMTTPEGASFVDSL